MLHGKRDPFVNDQGANGELEREADDFAGRILIPPRHESELRTITTLAEVQVFARKLHLPADIVVGRLQRECTLDHAVGNKLRRRFAFGGAAEGPARE
jgi:Zn-dependent peptidase ImmA (M78 family)